MEDNVFEKADEAKTETNVKVTEEERIFNQGLGILDEVTADEVTVTTDVAQYPKEWKATKLSGVATTGLRTAPIPSGFVASGVDGENTIAGGLVIYQGTTPVTETNHEVAMTSRDQFVWIPVEDINQMVMCKDNNIVEGANGSKICNLVLQSDGSLKCMTHHANDDGTELCGRLYGTGATYTTVDGKHIYKNSMNFSNSNRSQTWDTTSYHEPDTTPDAINGDASANGLAGVNSILGTSASSYDEATDTAWKTELTTNFNNMAKSVAKYGGFYIGRYEAGYNSSSYTSFKGKTVMNATTTTDQGADRWYGLYSHLKGTKEEATSSMIWGCQYDQVVKFIGEEAQIGHTDRNLYASTTTGTISGTTPLDMMKNIYDLEGNYWEWTALAYSTTNRSGRGGSYRLVAGSYFTPASDRGGNYPTSTYAYNSSRPTLYM